MPRFMFTCDLRLPTLRGVFCALTLALFVPGASIAASGPSGGAALGVGTGTGASSATSGGSGGASVSSGPTPTQSHASNQPVSPQASGAASGTIVGVSWASLTVQTGGRRMSKAQALIAAANALTTANFPYVWAGGHPAAGAASIGTRGPGFTGHTLGFDCSGSVAAVLSSVGLWQPGTPVPSDAGVIAQLRQEHLIAKGVGSGSTEVTLYDDPNVHILMNIDGRFFGTGANAKGGPGWLTYSGVTRAFNPWHFVPSALAGGATYGPELTFGSGNDSNLLYGLSVGQHVQVHYKTAKTGALTATAVSGS
jgi:hypothetical protein